MIRFRLTHTPHPLLVLPPADDPDLPAPRPPKKLAAPPGAAERTEVLAGCPTVGAGRSVEAGGADLALPNSAPPTPAAVEKDD